MTGDRIVAVSVLTGFLGSGKTTVLRHLLSQPFMTRIAVVINEFGEVGLDQHLVGTQIDDQAVLLENGCLCCTVRDDLIRTLRHLYVRQAAGEIPPFDRMIIETTGLADPTAIVHSLLTDQLLADCYRLDGVITTVDSATGSSVLDMHPEAIRQIALADRLLLTKTDIADPADRNALEDRMRSLNPAAPVIQVVDGEVAPERLLNAGYYDPDARIADVGRWLAAEAYDEPGHRHAGRHNDRIGSFCLRADQPLEWPLVSAWLRRLVQQHGPNLLRIKGLLDVAGRPTPVVVHAVRHLFHPPVALDSWPDAERQSKIVFIGIDPDRSAVELSFAAEVVRLSAATKQGLEPVEG